MSNSTNEVFYYYIIILLFYYFITTGLDAIRGKYNKAYKIMKYYYNYDYDREEFQHFNSQCMSLFASYVDSKFRVLVSFFRVRRSGTEKLCFPYFKRHHAY